MEATHSALDVYIYILSNVGPHLKIALWIPKYSGPNWLLYRDIENYVATELLVFVAGFCRGMQFSVATSSLSFFLDFVATNFNNVTT